MSTHRVGGLCGHRDDRGLSGWRLVSQPTRLLRAPPFSSVISFGRVFFVLRVFPLWQVNVCVQVRTRIGCVHLEIVTQAVVHPLLFALQQLAIGGDLDVQGELEVQQVLMFADLPGQLLLVCIQGVL